MQIYTHVLKQNEHSAQTAGGVKHHSRKVRLNAVKATTPRLAPRRHSEMTKVGVCCVSWPANFEASVEKTDARCQLPLVYGALRKIATASPKPPSFDASVACAVRAGQMAHSCEWVSRS